MKKNIRFKYPYYYWIFVDFTKVVIIGEDPEREAREYLGYPLIIIYPNHKNPSREFLIRKDVTILHSEYSHYPDIESMKIVRDMVFYLLNTSHLNQDDMVLVIFDKLGEKYEILLDLSKMKYPTLISELGDRLSGEIIENLLRLSMAVAKKGREGIPTGALFVVGDSSNVKRYIIQKIANPIKSLSIEERSILDERNFDTLREFATMDGAMIIDSRGYVLTCGAYIKTLFVEEWLADGLGGRHLAGKSITRLTRAISFVVSSEGTIRIYRDGRLVYELDSF